MVLTALAALPACAQVLGIEETTLEEESEPTGPLACLGAERAAPSGQNITITITTTTVTGMAAEPLEGVTAKACTGFAGVNCDPSTVAGTSGADGIIELAVPVGSNGFEGYLRFEAPNFTTLLWYFARRPRADFAFEAQMIPAPALDGLVEQVLGLTVDDSKGHVTFTARDCDNEFFAGLSVDLAPQSGSRFYADGPAFVPDSVQSTTTSTGRGGFFNVNTGTVKITGTQVSDDTLVSELGGVFVLADAISTVDLDVNQ